MNTWTKTCHQCGRLQVYSSGDSFRGAVCRNTVCRECVRVQRIKYPKETWKRDCPVCNDNIIYSKYLNWWRAKDENRMCEKCASNYRKKTQFQQGHPNFCISKESRKKLSDSGRKRYANPKERKRASEIAKIAMHRPDVRKTHLKALSETKYLGKALDKGQLELLEKWNKLGFKFEPNYQLYTDEFLCYIDGYDKTHNVVIEYDSKYHQKPRQKEKDQIRQNKIINILKPNKFWRYDSVNKQFRNVLEREG
jgi:hypothetical protein